MNEPVIDLEDVLERVQDDKELLLELFDIFIEDYVKKIVVLKTAVSSRNFEQIKDIIHSIKGAAGNISAKAVYSLSFAIEQSALIKDIDAIERSLLILEKHFQNLLIRIEEIKKESL